MFSDGDQNVPSGNSCMGTSVAVGTAAGATVAAGVEVATGPEVGWAVAVSALADGAAADAAPAADDAPALQADSASPTPRPSTEMLTILVMRMKCGKLIIISFY